MKSRLFDHIDLRVKDVERAKKFYVPVLNALGFTVDQKIKDWVSYEAPQAEGRPTEFFGFTHDPNHKPNGKRIAFWAETRVTKLTASRKWRGRRARRTSKGRRFTRSRTITRCFSKTRRATSWKCVAGSNRSVAQVGRPEHNSGRSKGFFVVTCGLRFYTARGSGW